jgi:glycosyltransferase involved in cell wall biosynthesis
MRVALSALSIKPDRTGGGETVLVHLMDALPRIDTSVRYLLFVTEENKGLFSTAAESVQLYVVPAWVRGVGRRVIYEMVYMPSAVHRWRADIFFAVNQVASPLFACPVSSLVQNLLYYFYGELYPRQWRPQAWLRRIFFRGLGRWSVRRASQVIAVSETVRKVIAQFDGVENAEVVPLAANIATVPLSEAQLEPVRIRMGAPFFVYVGALEPYKNIQYLIEALALLRRRPEAHAVRLALVGSGGAETGLRSLAREIGVEDAIEWVGNVPHRQIGAWYAASIGAVLLSRCEAFPLVPLEAMAQGVSVIGSNCSAVPEVVGRGGLIVDPYDVEAVAETMYKLATDEKMRAELSILAQLRVREFSWQRTAAELVGQWSKICSRRT